MPTSAVLQHWVLLVVDGEVGTEGWGTEIQRRATFFYADNVIIASTQLEWIQGAFDALMGMLNRVGLRTNVGKTVVMICQTCCYFGKHSDMVYELKMTGEGMT